MTRYGEGTCTECGTVSELLLAPRFPHICSRCLFPTLYAPPGLGQLVQALMPSTQRRNRVAS